MDTNTNNDHCGATGELLLNLTVIFPLAIAYVVVDFCFSALTLESSGWFGCLWFAAFVTFAIVLVNAWGFAFYKAGILSRGQWLRFGKKKRH